MKRLGVWETVVGFDNLYLAYRKARRGKGASPEIGRFALNLEREWLSLQDGLQSGAYRPGPYRLFTIYERKPRQIAAAPFRDRVAHHAVMNLVEPPLDRTFIHDSYACRKDKGVHRAVDRYQTWARRYAYALKMDVQRYFPSIDRDLLKEKLRRRIKDRNVLRLLDTIVDTGPASGGPPVYFPGDDLRAPLGRRTGIPIGNLTSQFFANLYLDDLDHYLKETLRVRAYLRYVDDLVVLGDDKARLRLHPNKAHVTPTAHGLDVLGYFVFPRRRRLRNDNGHRFARRLRRFAQLYRHDRLGWDDFNPSVQSWLGHARHADTRGLRRQIFSETVFVRGTGQGAATA